MIIKYDSPKLFIVLSNWESSGIACRYLSSVSKQQSSIRVLLTAQEKATFGQYFNCILLKVCCDFLVSNGMFDSLCYFIFSMQLMKVERLSQKLHIMSYIGNFFDTYQHLQPVRTVSKLSHFIYLLYLITHKFSQLHKGGKLAEW